MGLIQDRRPRDWGYRVAFDRKDLTSLEKMARHIRETHDTDMIESFNARCEQKLNTGSAELDNGIEIQSVAKTDDLAVNGGLQQCINIILGISSTRFRYIALGATLTPAAVTDTALGLESGGSTAIRIDTLSLGWNEAIGMKLFYGGIYGEDSSLNDVFSEFGVFTTAGPSTGTMLNKNVFTSVTRTTSHAVFIISSVIEFCPVA